MLYKVGPRLVVKWSLCIQDLQEHLFQQTLSSNVQLCEDFSADNKYQWKYFSCSLSKRRMGSHSIYDMNKGLGKMKCLVSFVTMVTTTFRRPTDFSLLTEWFVTEFQRSVVFIIFWLKQLIFSFAFCLVFALQSNMAKTWENLLMLFTVLKPLALANKEECCSAPKMSSLVSRKCLITWPHRTKGEAVLDALCITVCLQQKILHLSFKYSARIQSAQVQLQIIMGSCMHQTLSHRGEKTRKC